MSSTSNAVLEMEMENSLQRTYQNSQFIRPAATKALYDPKVQEFKDWCILKGFPESTQFTVTEAKLHLFLDECVIGRQKRKKKNKDSNEEIGYQTVLAYVSAITDFYKQQKMSGINSNSTPRGNTVKLLLQQIESQTEAVRRRNFEDRGKNTMLDVITSNEELKMVFIILKFRYQITICRKQVNLD